MNQLWCAGLRAAVLILGVIIFNAALPGGKAVAADAVVKIDNFTFNPQTLTIPVGTTVIFVNNDDIPHVVEEKANKFRSPALDTGEKFSHKFTQAETVDYFCAIHPHMTGKIVVVP